MRGLHRASQSQIPMIVRPVRPRCPRAQERRKRGTLGCLLVVVVMVVAGPGPGLARRAEGAVGKGHWLLLLLESGEEQDQDPKREPAAVPEVVPPPASVRQAGWQPNKQDTLALVGRQTGGRFSLYYGRAHGLPAEKLPLFNRAQI
ncbi:hypothetical protein B0T26DRAFT_801207 [Lasiosphaeria miniovina]|uniref:Uncharacterized protein n=1 Tax=Lasiosphaeria miniovina TaxID=1954250 RepID=A0AA40AUZ1_9PEZI|nr:uncharacterized protein B0T26DRAFT_801207 [Lasiosphaeria miniovina]KAK0722453.1 hypothetical protein B0T26DRAFT_801207 [Lasiosphaeria miniovina]